MKGESFHIQPSGLPGVMAVDARSARSFARHAHEEFGVGLMTDGAQRSASGRGQVEAIRGDLITVNPSEIHDGAPIGAVRSWSMLYFTQETVARIVADMEEGRRSTRELHAPVINDAPLARLFIATRQAVLNPQGAAAIEESLLLLFGRMFCVARPERALPGQLAKVRERIDDAPASSHALADLAAMAGLSRYQTLRGFARMTGLTPHAYVLQRRLDAARCLIRNGCALADAAVEAGFSDQSHMNRIFMARHGFTPGAYAAAVRPGPAISSKNDARPHC